MGEIQYQSGGSRGQGVLNDQEGTSAKAESNLILCCGG